MTTAIIHHPACLEHDTGHSHPESAERLRLTIEALSAPEFSGLMWRSAPCAEQGHLLRVHTQQYVSAIFDAVPASGHVEYDATGTVLSAGSTEAALRAAGAATAAVDLVVKGKAQNAFCAVRPPGHHAERDRTSGFCLFNNVAIGVRHAQIAHGVKRAAVIDFDVHHGNGTEAAFRDDADVFFASSHQSFIFPMTGHVSDCGVGNVVNISLERGTNGARFRDIFAEKILPRLAEFAPEFIFISAGFDAHRSDPIGDLRLDDIDFEWVTSEIAKIAASVCDGRVVSVLEGGYHPRAVANAAASHVRALMNA